VSLFYGAPPMNIIACKRRYAHEHVDRIMGHLLVNSGIRCQVILVKRAARERRKWRAVSAGYTYSVVVTISKVLDLVGIRSILEAAAHFRRLAAGMLLVKSQATANSWRAFGRRRVAVQKGALASKLARCPGDSAPTVVAAIRVLPFASVVLLE
jgi:hypothetical protein